MKIFRFSIAVILISLLIQIGYTGLVALGVFREKRVDVFGAQDTIFQTEAKGVVYSTPLIAKRTNYPQIVILGASNANLGFRPEEIQPLVHGATINNLSIGGQNIHSLSELVDLLYRQTPRQQRHNLTFVVGSWYGLTVEDHRRWPTGRTDVDQELLRYGIFNDVSLAQPLHQRVPDAMLSTAFISAWPLMLPYSIFAESTRVLFQRGVVRTLPKSVADRWYAPQEVREAATLSQAAKLQGQKYFSRYVGPVSDWKDTGFDELISLGNKINAQGGRLILADLPVTSLGMETEAFPAYNIRMRKTVSTLQKNPSFTYLNLQDALGDADFFDLVHPRPSASPKLAALIANVVNAKLSK